MAIDFDFRDLRARQAKIGTDAVFKEMPICTLCGDHGYWTIRYPRGGYETIRPCNCQAAKDRFGANTFEEMDNRDAKTYWDDMRMYFGGKDREETERIMGQYTLVKKPLKYPKAERVYEWVRKESQNESDL